jgi:hypothetical protein
MVSKTVTRTDLSEAVYQKVGLSRAESADWSSRSWGRSATAWSQVRR